MDEGKDDSRIQAMEKRLERLEMTQALSDTVSDLQSQLAATVQENDRLTFVEDSLRSESKRVPVLLERVQELEAENAQLNETATRLVEEDRVRSLYAAPLKDLAEELQARIARELVDADGSAANAMKEVLRLISEEQGNESSMQRTVGKPDALVAAFPPEEGVSEVASFHVWA